MNCGNKVTTGAVTFGYKLGFGQVLLKLERLRRKEICQSSKCGSMSLTFPGSNRTGRVEIAIKNKGPKWRESHLSPGLAHGATRLNRALQVLRECGEVSVTTGMLCGHAPHWPC